MAGSCDDLVDELMRQLTSLKGEAASSIGELDSRVERLVEVFRRLRKLSLTTSSLVLVEPSASGRILEYLRAHVGIPITGTQLEVVSGISEYARRVREWRVEFGWPIEHDKKRRVYLLTSDQPNESKAELWTLLNGIRRSGTSARDKMLGVFLGLPEDTIVSTAQLRYVTDGKDMRRVRELRTELGWKIFTKNTGRVDLKSGQYVLADKVQQEEHDRHIEDKVLARVLERDKHTCRKAGCNWSPVKRAAGDPRQYLEAHHVDWHSDKGTNDADNLITLCNVHHRDVHTNKLKDTNFWSWLADPN